MSPSSKLWQEQLDQRSLHLGQSLIETISAKAKCCNAHELSGQCSVCLLVPPVRLFSPPLISSAFSVWADRLWSCDTSHHCQEQSTANNTTRPHARPAVIELSFTISRRHHSPFPSSLPDFSSRHMLHLLSTDVKSNGLLLCRERHWLTSVSRSLHMKSFELPSRERPENEHFGQVLCSLKSYIEFRSVRLDFLLGRDRTKDLQRDERPAHQRNCSHRPRFLSTLFFSGGVKVDDLIHQRSFLPISPLCHFDQPIESMSIRARFPSSMFCLHNFSPLSIKIFLQLRRIGRDFNSPLVNRSMQLNKRRQHKTNRPNPIASFSKNNHRVLIDLPIKLKISEQGKHFSQCRNRPNNSAELRLLSAALSLGSAQHNSRQTTPAESHKTNCRCSSKVTLIEQHRLTRTSHSHQHFCSPLQRTHRIHNLPTNQQNPLNYTLQQWQNTERPSPSQPHRTTNNFLLLSPTKNKRLSFLENFLIPNSLTRWSTSKIIHRAHKVISLQAKHQTILSALPQAQHFDVSDCPRCSLTRSTLGQWTAPSRTRSPID